MLPYLDDFDPVFTPGEGSLDSEPECPCDIPKGSEPN